MPSYDIVGDITAIRILKRHPDELKLAAKNLLQRHVNVKTVLGPDWQSHSRYSVTDKAEFLQSL